MAVRTTGAAGTGGLPIRAPDIEPKTGCWDAAGSVAPLSKLDVLVIDCQATAAAPRGHLLEIGWARVGRTVAGAQAWLTTLPGGERVPPAVARITGITDRMMRGGVPPHLAWRVLSEDAATLTPQPAPTVIHFARFERPFLWWLAGGMPPLDIVCTHEIARRLLPDLPRRGLRALAGYFGRAVGPLRRSADHVEATAFVWRELTRLLAAEGVSTWKGLHAWLAAPMESGRRRRRRAWPMPRDVRLQLPDAPGIYRMLRTSGDVLYVGKASSLRDRVNSYFRHQRGVPERMLEMLSQARAISFDVTPSVLEAALLEPDEIKRHHPPYNVALAGDDRHVWFADPDLGERSPRRSSRCRIGPFPSAEALEQFAALSEGSPSALGRGRWAPEATSFDAGYARFREAHPELSRIDLGMAARLLRLGTRLWREGRRDRGADADEPSTHDRRVTPWTPEYVQSSLERLALRAALARRRAIWLTRLAEASVGWREPGARESRVIVIENGEVTLCGTLGADVALPVPPGHRRPFATRHQAFTVARLDRLRVLTAEFKRLVAARAPVAVRFGAAPPLAGVRLGTLLSWL